MRIRFNKALSIFLSIVMVMSVIVFANASDTVNAVNNVPQNDVGTLKVGESYTFNFNEGEVIETIRLNSNE